VDTILNLRPDELKPSPFNPRKHLGDVAELAASLKQVGMLEPVVARLIPDAGPNAGLYEIVCGHRRHAAAKLAELADVPTIVREYSDDDVLEVMIVENSQRADVHPLDEADGFKALIGRGRTVIAIADKVGRSASYVAQRLQLCELCSAGRKALDEEKITLGAAMVLARVPNKLQQEAVEEALSWHRYGEDTGAAASAKSVREHIEEHFMLRLDQAPFPLDDATLRPKVGACTACPKRTGNQAELFADVASKDLCTEPRCFKEKTRLYWPIRAKAAKEAGQAVLDGKAGKAAAAAPYSKGYERVDGHQVWTGSKHVDARKIVDKAKVPVTLAFDEDEGRIVELVKRVDLDKAVRKESPVDKDTSSHRYDHKAAEAKREREQRIQRRSIALALEQAIAEVEERAAAAPTSHKVSDCIDTLVRGFIVRAWSDTISVIIKRRGLELAKPKNRTHQTSNEALLKILDGMTRPERLGLGVELGLLAIAPGNWGAKSPLWAPSLKSLGVDATKCEAQAAAEEKERAAAKKAREKKKGKAGAKAAAKTVKAKAERGVCRECGCTDPEPCATDHGPCCWVDTTETLCSRCAP
jgi:ParB/RepB/Spo0J family partition protein